MLVFGERLNAMFLTYTSLGPCFNYYGVVLLLYSSKKTQITLKMSSQSIRSFLLDEALGERRTPYSYWSLD